MWNNKFAKFDKFVVYYFKQKQYLKKFANQKFCKNQLTNSHHLHNLLNIEKKLISKIQHVNNRDMKYNWNLNDINHFSIQNWCDFFSKKNHDYENNCHSFPF